MLKVRNYYSTMRMQIFSLLRFIFSFDRLWSCLIAKIQLNACMYLRVRFVRVLGILGNLPKSVLKWTKMPFSTLQDIFTI